MRITTLILAVCLSLQAKAQQDCNKIISYDYDSFEGEHRFFTSPRDEKGREERIYLEKALSKVETKYFLYLKVHYTTFYPALTDVVIRFADGSTLSRKQHIIEVKPSTVTDFYRSSTLIRLQENELPLLSAKRIDGFRIQTDDFKLSQAESYRLKAGMVCLKKVQLPK